MTENKGSSEWFVSSVLAMVDDLDRQGFDEELDRERIDEAISSFLDNLAERYNFALHKRQAMTSGFYYRFNQRWEHALNILKFHILLNEQAGALFASMYEPTEKDYLFSALVRLHARACQVSREVLSLIQAGYADGAFARWRSIYEIAAVARFIKKYGDDTAKRFLFHRRIDDFHEMRSYQNCHDELGFQPIDKDVVEQVKENRENLLDEYGKEFDGTYGWAADDLTSGSAKIKYIIQDTSIEEYWAHYKFASDSVHGGSKGTQYRLGLTDDSQDEVMLVGPTNHGFTDSAQFTAIMLSHVTNAFLYLSNEPYWTVISETLHDFSEDVSAAFAIAPVESNLKNVSEAIAERIVEEVGVDLLEGEGDVELDEELIDERIYDIFGIESDL